MFKVKLSTNIGHIISSAYYYPKKNTFKVFFDPVIAQGIYRENEYAVTVGKVFDEMALFELLIDANKRNMCVYGPLNTSQSVLDNFERIQCEYREILRSKDTQDEKLDSPSSTSKK